MFSEDVVELHIKAEAYVVCVCKNSWQNNFTMVETHWPNKLAENTMSQNGDAAQYVSVLCSLNNYFRFYFFILRELLWHSAAYVLGYLYVVVCMSDNFRTVELRKCQFLFYFSIDNVVIE